LLLKVVHSSSCFPCGASPATASQVHLTLRISPNYPLAASLTGSSAFLFALEIGAFSSSQTVHSLKLLQRRVV